MQIYQSKHALCDFGITFIRQAQISMSHFKKFVSQNTCNKSVLRQRPYMNEVNVTMTR